MPRHFHDDDDRSQARSDEGDTSSGLPLALIVGVFLVVGLGCVTVVSYLFLRTQAVRQEVMVAQMEAEAAVAQAEATRVADQTSPPRPPATLAAPTDLGPERPPEVLGHWTILFRSDDPAYWNTTGNDRHYAVPLRLAPASVRYVRLKRMDTGEALIVRLTSERLAAGPKAGEPSRWNGSNNIEANARHFGAVHFPRLPADGATVVVLSDELGGAAGSGFGHSKSEGPAQRYSWRGQEIGKTIFEIAVTANELTADEKKLVAAGSNP